jgi:molybdopterin molybdotransferase
VYRNSAYLAIDKRELFCYNTRVKLGESKHTMSLTNEIFPLTGISAERAIDVISSACNSPETEILSLYDAYGRVLAEDITAASDIPPFDRSPYDGYALISADTANAPVTLKVLEEVSAGNVPSVTVISGTAVKILTGAPVPEGADAVVKYEDTDFTAESVTMLKAVLPGDIVPKGEDVRAGTVIARRGDEITPSVAGNMAAQGIERLSVYKRPRIGIISTGNELINSGKGAIHDTNRVTLEAAIKRIGANPVFLGTAGDKYSEIERLIDFKRTDMIISTGGMGKSDHDFTLSAFENCGARLKIRNLDFRPGGAFAYLELERHGTAIPCVCLAGNPAAAMVTFFAMAQPCIRKLCGSADWRNERVKAALTEGYGKSSPAARLIVGAINISSGKVMFQCSERGKGSVSSFDGANALAIVPKGSPELDAGTEVDAYLI